MNRSLMLALVALFATSQASPAQVCPLRKDPQFLATLKSVDEKCEDLMNLVNARKRKWQSGYKFATGDERVKFAIAYQDFLVSKGETGDGDDFSKYKLVSYEDRQAWAMQWWAKEDKNFAGLSSLDEKANWVHDSLVDAGNSLHLTTITLHQMHKTQIGDAVSTKDNVELTAVDSRYVQKHP